MRVRPAPPSAPDDGRRYVEAAHDALILTWDRMRDWRDEESETLPVVLAVQQAVDDRRERQGGLWQSDPRLRQAEAVIRRDPLRFSAPERSFLNRSAHWRDFWRAFFVLLCVSTLVASVVFYRQRQQAIQQRYRSLIQALVAQAPQELRSGNDERAALLLRLAYLFEKQRQTGISQDALYQGLIQTQNQLPFTHVLPAGERPINAVAFSPDGKWLACAGQEGVVRVWRLTRLPSPPTLLRTAPPDTPLQAILFSPDSRCLLAGGDNGVIYRWVAGTARVPWGEAPPIALRRWLPGLERGDIALTFSRRGDILSAAVGERCVLLRFPSLLRMSAFAAPSGIQSVALDPQALFLLAGDSNGNVLAWELARPDAKPYVALRFPTPDKQFNFVNSLIVTPSGSQVIAGCSSGEVRSVRWLRHLPEAARNEVRLSHSPRQTFSAGVAGIALSADGAIFAAGGAEGELRAYHGAASAASRRIFQANRDGDGVLGVALSPDGALAATANVNGTVRLWETRTDDRFRVQTIGPKALRQDVYSLTASADDRFLAAARNDKPPLIWDDKERRGLTFPLPSGRSPIFGTDAVAFHPASPLLAVAAQENDRLYLWDAAMKRPPREIAAAASSLAFSPHGDQLATNGAIYRLSPTPKRIAELPSDAFSLPRHLGKRDTARGRVVASAPAGVVTADILAVGDEDGSVRLYSWRDPGASPAALYRDAKGVWRVASLLNRSPAPPAAEEVDLNVMAETERRRSLRGVAPVTALAFSPDGRYLIVGHEDGTAERWDGTALAERRDSPPLVWRTGLAAVTAVAFSRADLPQMALADADGVIRVAAPTSPDASLFTLGSRGVKVYSLTFVRKGKWLAAGTSEGRLTLYPSSLDDMADDVCRRITQPLRLAEWANLIGTDIPYQNPCSNLPTPAQ